MAIREIDVDSVVSYPFCRLCPARLIPVIPAGTTQRDPNDHPLPPKAQKGQL